MPNRRVRKKGRRLAKARNKGNLWFYGYDKTIVCECVRMIGDDNNNVISNRNNNNNSKQQKMCVKIKIYD